LEYYKDLREYIRRLDELGLLVKIQRPIVKETELASLVKLQFRGLPEEERKGFLFEKVIDSKGRSYVMKVATGILASSRKIYALGMNCPIEEIPKKWAEAQSHPIEPVLVKDGPVHEVVQQGDQLLEDGKGIEELPVPVEVPGYSGQIRTSNSAIVTKDVETGIRNVGNYSGHIFGKTKVQWEIAKTNHGFIHWQKAKARGKKLQAAIVVGATPSVTYTAMTKIPYGIDEFSVAGGIAGSPVELVKCKTVDLEVPASAEIVIEVEAGTEFLEPGNAFGEYTGYMATDVVPRPVFHVTCITHRKDAIFPHIISQFPPSESSVMRKIGYENVYLKFLKHDCNNPNVLDVGLMEMSQARFIVVKMKKTHPAQPWQALYAATAFDPQYGKIVVTVDDDIDPRDPDGLIWALSFAMQPHRDIRIVRGKYPELDVSAFRQDASRQEKDFPGDQGSGAILIDATRKFPYPPKSLPKKEYMEAALKIWKDEGLPELQLKDPWYGEELGFWPAEYREDAEKIVKGEQYLVGKRLEQKRERV
jgi:4-hydroxy-3-polyprenylbenzoate decarboxylase